jgi:hypothetical protein
VKARFDDAVEMDWSEVDDQANDRIAQVNAKVELAWPFVVRLADTWEKKFLPSMSGEHSVVMSSGNLAAKQWIQEMRPAIEPLPLPEIATVTGVKDVALFKSAWNDLFAICDDVVAAIRKESPDAIPAGYNIPRPKESKLALGEKFGYPIPDDCPVPKDMMPQAFFSGNYVIMSYSDKQSVALAESKKFEFGNDVIDPKAKQSAASYIHVGKILEMANPWVKYALTENLEDLDASLIPESAPAEVLQYEFTGKDVLALWKALGTIGEFTSCTTATSDGVTHVRSTYRSRVSK